MNLATAAAVCLYESAFAQRMRSSGATRRIEILGLRPG